ncbi:hypothetical protein B9479_007774 [Cryptococcus floricola]|uniref:Uncharacterized protein n=1 Tax=Cryptococcus floricola TaxID=2591691 RepID=A0A5D3ANN8_9TREE|nr:hypothetical protein B9479_007774 [Cryptococcus floricola]
MSCRQALSCRSSQGEALDGEVLLKLRTVTAKLPFSPPVLPRVLHQDECQCCALTAPPNGNPGNKSSRGSSEFRSLFASSADHSDEMPSSTNKNLDRTARAGSIIPTSMSTEQSRVWYAWREREWAAQGTLIAQVTPHYRTAISHTPPSVLKLKAPLQRLPHLGTLKLAVSTEEWALLRKVHQVMVFGTLSPFKLPYMVHSMMPVTARVPPPKRNDTLEQCGDDTVDTFIKYIPEIGVFLGAWDTYITWVRLAKYGTDRILIPPTAKKAFFESLSRHRVVLPSANSRLGNHQGSINVRMPQFVAALRTAKVKTLRIQSIGLKSEITPGLEFAQPDYPQGESPNNFDIGRNFYHPNSLILVAPAKSGVPGVKKFPMFTPRGSGYDEGAIYRGMNAHQARLVTLSSPDPPNRPR